MKKSIRRILTGVVAALAVGATAIAPTQAEASPNNDWHISFNGGYVRWATFTEHSNGTGNVLTVSGGRDCTSYKEGWTGAEWREPRLGEWDNSISWGITYGNCKVALHSFENYQGYQTNWFRMAGAVDNHPDARGWNDWTSSFRLS
ncbi:hypothetical protein LKO27_07745 [Tessaracoccus sp. OS52]|uniref:hypothetical protein n=1 Tax=Tessaracoccus sp. OS52 TaxID=2886691 RepID=UPI001D0FC829|nr:hypothetical protein [Tessaracoccus sp. OS52]MCC2593300.1 hypothetical protein [Tessaracoccus sp. OS52]